jgi:putative membrane protein
VREEESRLAALAVRFGINAVALWVASTVVSGFEVEGWPSVLALAAIFGVVNAMITPVAQLVGLPITCLTLGVFAIVVNAAMLGLSVWIADLFDLDVHIDWFWGAFFAALVVTVTSWLLNMVAGQKLRRVLS